VRCAAPTNRQSARYRASVATIFDQYFATQHQQIEQWSPRGTVQLNDAQAARHSQKELQQIRASSKNSFPSRSNGKSSPEAAVSAAEFLPEGMYAHKRISRAEERIFSRRRKETTNNDAANYAEKCADARSTRRILQIPHPPRLQLDV